MKDTAFQGLALPGRRRVRGLAATALAISFQLFAVNVRATQAAVAEAQRKKPRPPRKRRVRLSDYKPPRATALVVS